MGKEKEERFRIVKKAELGAVKKIIRQAAAHKGNGAVTGRRSPEQAQPFLCGLPLTSRTFIVYASFLLCSACILPWRQAIGKFHLAHKYILKGVPFSTFPRDARPVVRELKNACPQPCDGCRQAFFSVACFSKVCPQPCRGE